MNALRVSFLVVTDVAMIALLASLLGGCVTTPSLQNRNGDFVSHMASIESVSGDYNAVRRIAPPVEARPSQPARG